MNEPLYDSDRQKELLLQNQKVSALADRLLHFQKIFMIFISNGNAARLAE
jgi:hypothetical protein